MVTNGNYTYCGTLCTWNNINYTSIKTKEKNRAQYTVLVLEMESVDLLGGSGRTCFWLMLIKGKRVLWLTNFQLGWLHMVKKKKLENIVWRQVCVLSVCFVFCFFFLIGILQTFEYARFKLSGRQIGSMMYSRELAS